MTRKRKVTQEEIRKKAVPIFWYYKFIELTWILALVFIPYYFAEIVIRVFNLTFDGSVFMQWVAGVILGGCLFFIGWMILGFFQWNWYRAKEKAEEELRKE